MLLKNHDANEYADTCGIRCKVEVNESVNQARNELQNGNTSGALLHLDAAKMEIIYHNKFYAISTKANLLQDIIRAESGQ